MAEKNEQNMTTDDKMKELFDLDPYSGHDNLDAAFTLSIIDSGLPLFD